MITKNPAFTFSCDSPSSLSLLLQSLANIPENLKPLLPFILIKLIASQQWKAIMNITSNATKKPTEADHVMTSCVLSSYAAMICLLGKSNAEKFFNLMTKSITYEFDVSLPSGKKQHYVSNNLFDGDIVREMRNDKILDENDWAKKAGKYVQPYLDKFFAHAKAELQKNNFSDDKTFISVIGNVFKNLKYDFNETTIAALKSEILVNEKDIDRNKSYMYWIGITEPLEKDLSSLGFHHIFLIEQFKFNDEVHYRIYQSWIKQGTLLEDFAKHPNSLTHQEMVTFLDKFVSVYSQGKNPKNITPKECFGYSAKRPSFVMFDGKILSGLNVRYCAIPMNPNECLNNFIEFAKSTPELKSKTFRLGG